MAEHTEGDQSWDTSGSSAVTAENDVNPSGAEGAAASILLLGSQVEKRRVSCYVSSKGRAESGSGRGITSCPPRIVRTVNTGIVSFLRPKCLFSALHVYFLIHSSGYRWETGRGPHSP